jgi:hypothetical protein
MISFEIHTFYFRLKQYRPFVWGMQANLTIEKNNLAASVKKLTRDVAKVTP